MTNLTGKEPQTWRLSISGRSYEKVSPKKDKLIVAESASALFLISKDLSTEKTLCFSAAKLQRCIKEEMPPTTNNTVERQPKEGYNSLAKVIAETKGKRQMLTYDTLIEEALEALPLFRERYERETAAGMIDTDDGKHIIFGLVFTPMLEELIRNNTQPELQKALDFLEKMASSEDGRVVEVCDQSVLEV